MDYVSRYVYGGMAVNDTEVLEYMNVIGRLGKPRLSLIKALCAKKYGPRYYTATEFNAVIAENELQLYRDSGSLRTEKQIQDAMSIAHLKLKEEEHTVISPNS